jgi:hypothetical protein
MKLKDFEAHEIITLGFLTMLLIGTLCSFIIYSFQTISNNI